MSKYSINQVLLTAKGIAALKADVDGKIQDKQLTIIATLLGCLRQAFLQTLSTELTTL